jgi:tetratricopeptide (TPR) repeat protein
MDGSDGAKVPPVIQVGVPAGLGVQVGDHNAQQNKFIRASIETQYVGTQVVQVPPAPPIGQVVAGNVPQEPPAFQLRMDLLDVLRAAGPGVSVVRAVTGMRGVGKTQVAAAYARTCIDAGWRLVAWINAGDMAKVLDGLAVVAERLRIGEDGASLVALGELVRDRLAAGGEYCLVVFDNVTDLAELRRFLPAAGKSQIVITSTSTEAAKFGVPTPVDVFAADEALAFLAERTRRDDSDGARELAEELGHLPLALAQAGAVIAAQHLTYQVYLDRLRSLSVRDYLIPVDGEPYPRGVAEVILLSMDAVAEADRTGLCSDLVDVISLLSTTGVSRELLYAAGPAGVFSRLGPISRGAIDEAVGRLAGASLLTFSGDDSAVSAHRLVMRVARERRAHDGSLASLAARTCKLLEAVALSLGLLWQHRAAARDLVLHVAALDEHLSPHLYEDDAALTKSLLALRLWALRSLRDLGDSDIQAIEFGESLVSDSERVLGDAHPDTLTSRNSLASAYRAAGRLDEAIAVHEQTLADRERVLGAEHPDTLASRNDLAVAYKAANRLDEAIALHEQNLADSERVLGAEHQDTLVSRSSLASAYGAAGRSGEAIALHERTLADRERVLGDGHPHTLTSRNNLAYAYHNAGRLDEAIAVHERTLADCERLLGRYHSSTLRSRCNLAYNYHSAGRLDEAIALYERMISDHARVLGEAHRDTLLLYSNLAAAYREAGRAEEAIPLYERALAGLERALGSDHPSTIRVRDNLAAARREATGRADHDK